MMRRNAVPRGGSSKQQQVFGEQGVNLQLRFIDGQMEDRRIDLRGLDARQEAAGVALVDGDVHTWVGARHLPEQLGE